MWDRPRSVNIRFVSKPLWPQGRSGCQACGMESLVMGSEHRTPWMKKYRFEPNGVIQELETRYEVQTFTLTVTHVTAIVHFRYFRGRLGIQCAIPSAVCGVRRKIKGDLPYYSYVHQLHTTAFSRRSPHNYVAAFSILNCGNECCSLGKTITHSNDECLTQKTNDNMFDHIIVMSMDGPGGFAAGIIRMARSYIDDVCPHLNTITTNLIVCSGSA